MSTSLRPQERQRRLNDGKRAEDIRLEICTNILDRRLFNRAHEAVAGIAQDHVQPAKVLVGAIDGLEHRVTIRDIELKWKQPVDLTL